MGIIALALDRPMFSAAAAACPPFGLAAGVFAAGVALGATAAVWPVVGVAAVFVAGVALGAALPLRLITVPHHQDAVASGSAMGYLRVAKNAACSAFASAAMWFLARSAARAKNKEEEEEAPGPAVASAKRERDEMEMGRHSGGAQRHLGHDDFWAMVVAEAEAEAAAASSSAHVTCGCGPGGDAFGPRGIVDPSVSELLATRAAWRASEVMAALETLRTLEEKMGANIPPEAKSCVCVCAVAAVAGVCLEVFKPPSHRRGGAVWDGGRLLCCGHAPW